MNQSTNPEILHEAWAAGRPIREHGPYRVDIGDESLNYRHALIADPVPTGRQVLEAAGVSPVVEYGVFQVLRSGQIESLRLDETTDLRTRGVEKFLVFHSDRSYRFDIDGTVFEWGTGRISGRVLKILAKVDPVTFQSTRPGVFFGGDAAFGPKNIIWAVAQGHEAAISIDKWCQGQDVAERPAPMTTLISQKMGIHEWSYDNDVALDLRYKVPHLPNEVALKDIKAEVELGYDRELGYKETQRCLNCDVQTVFAPKLCIECDACVDICPIDCITFTENRPEPELRKHLTAPSINQTQDLYVGTGLKTGRVMVKDEDLCLHCGLCAERCPTGAWDMQKFLLQTAQAGQCQSR